MGQALVIPQGTHALGTHAFRLGLGCRTFGIRRCSKSLASALGTYDWSGCNGHPPVMSVYVFSTQITLNVHQRRRCLLEG
jgi:hypothetical protein